MDLFRPEPVAWLQRTIGLGHPLPFRLVTPLGVSWGILLAAAVAFWWFGRRSLYLLLVLAAVEAVIKKGLSAGLSVDRPDAGSIVKYERVGSVGSFPSGHVSTATALWGWLGAATGFPLALGILIAFTVGVSRLYLGTHYLADVVGGWVLGGVLAWGWLRFGPRTIKHAESWSYSTWVTLAVLVGAGTIAFTIVFAEESGYVWYGAALVVGAAVALPLEWKYIRYRPAHTAGGRARALGVGGLGWLALFSADFLAGEDAAGFGAAMVLLGTLWALLLAPAIFTAWGWSAHDEARRPGGVRAAARAGLVGIAVLVALTLYGSAIEPRFLLDVREERVALPGLSPALEGTRVALVADLQVGMWWDNVGMVERIVRRLTEDPPDLVLLAGDFIYGPGSDATDEMAEVTALLRPLARAELSALAVLGNHDWSIKQRDSAPDTAAARVVESGLEALGIPVLRNEARSVQMPGGTLWVAGVGSRWAGQDRPAVALEKVPGDAPRIVVLHHPDSFEEIPAHGAPLAVAGHTHGGQVRVSFLPSWSWLTFVAEDEVHTDGWAEDSYGAAGNHLYVNRGVGFSAVPVRIHARPELTYFTLVPARAAPGGSRE